MSVKLLTKHDLKFLSLKGGSTGSSESSLIKIPHCWKSIVTAHMESTSKHIISNIPAWCHACVAASGCHVEITPDTDLDSMKYKDSLIHGSAYNVDIILVFGDYNYHFFSCIYDGRSESSRKSATLYNSQCFYRLQ